MSIIYLFVRIDAKAVVAGAAAVKTVGMRDYV